MLEYGAQLEICSVDLEILTTQNPTASGSCPSESDTKCSPPWQHIPTPTLLPLGDLSIAPGFNDSQPRALRIAIFIATSCHSWHIEAMKFADLLESTAANPIFETGYLLAGDVDANDVRRQLVRWTNSGKIHQLRRGLYALAEPWAPTRPHPFVIANELVRGSYVSLQSALAYHGLIPEAVPVTTSVGPGSPNRWSTPWGDFEHRHLGAAYRRGYDRLEVRDDQHAFVARPEKALLDLVHLTPGGDDERYLRELRLQNLDRLDLDTLLDLAEALGKPKLRRAARRITEIAEEESERFESL